MRGCALAFVALLPGAACALDLRPSFDAAARRLIKEQATTGFVVGIVRRGETQVVPYGETRKGSGIAPDGDTLYEIGSITKLFTGIVLADAVRREQVRLEGPVQEYLPPEASMPRRGEPITLRHLVTHTSGLPRRPDNMPMRDPLNPYADYSVEQMYAFLRRHPLRSPPGRYEYSNLATGLLGHVLALKEQKELEQLMIERILAPLAMQDTRFVPHRGMLERLAPPHDAGLQPVKNWDLPTLGGAGGLRSTVNDMLKFIAANIARDNTPLGHAVRLSHTRLYTLPDGKGIGYAWRITRDDGIVFHTGTTGGYRAFVAVAPDRATGVVALTNTRSNQVVQLADRLIHVALAGAKAKPISVPAPGAEPPPED
jgi:serine-type D-Ala-D-Ala carboxypeptidase/endopeptidase